MHDPRQAMAAKSTFSSGGIVTGEYDGPPVWHCGDEIVRRAQTDLFKFPKQIAIDPACFRQGLANLRAKIMNLREAAK